MTSLTEPHVNNENRQLFEDLFKRVMGVETCSPDMAMKKLIQWDSLKHVELLTELDETFEVQIEATDLWKMTSVTGILDVLSKYVA